MKTKSERLSTSCRSNYNLGLYVFGLCHLQSIYEMVISFNQHSNPQF